MAQAKNRRGTALSIKLPTAMAQAIYQQVRDGHFDTAGGVVRAALCLMLGLDDDGHPIAPADDEPPRKASPKRPSKAADASRGDDDELD